MEKWINKVRFVPYEISLSLMKKKILPDATVGKSSPDSIINEIF